MAKKPAELLAGEKLRRLLLERNLTQEEFAERKRMDVRTVSRYINQGITKVAVIQEFADYFEVDIREFFT